jgi:CheY-like chemotaxis protein
MLLRKKLNCILLVDDDPDDNYFHQIVIKELDVVKQVDVAGNGLEALTYLKRENCVPPDLIFLDINMPRMNGWEFLAEYKHLPVHQQARVVIIFLTTSASPDDLRRARELEEVSGFETKPLTRETLTEILQEHFKENF